MIKLEGSTPIRYGLRLNMDEKYMGLKKQLSELCSLKPEQILLAEVHASNIKVCEAQKHLSTARLSGVNRLLFGNKNHSRISYLAIFLTQLYLCFRTSPWTTRRCGSLLTASCVHLKSQYQVHPCP